MPTEGSDYIQYEGAERLTKLQAYIAALNAKLDAAYSSAGSSYDASGLEATLARLTQEEQRLASIVGAASGRRTIFTIGRPR